MSTPSQTLVVLGAPQSGKSTILGHLLTVCETFSTEQAEAAARASQSAGRGEASKWAFLVDRHPLERQQGQTTHTTFHKLQTRKNLFTVVSAPGSNKYLKNRITGVACADVALLVVSAVAAEFDADLPTTEQHLTYAFCLGVKTLVVCINRFDEANWNNEAFTSLAAKITATAKACGYKTPPTIVPACGLLGDNLTKPSSSMPWYKGMSLLSALDDSTPPARPIDKAFRMSVQEVKSLKGKTVVVGQVGTGSIKPGSKVVVSPGRVVTQVASIQMFGEEVKQASAGDNVGVCLVGVHESMISAGSIAAEYKEDEALPVDRFVVQLMVRPAARPLKVQSRVMVDVHSTHAMCKIHRILHTIDKKTGKPDKVGPSSVGPGDVCWVELVPCVSMAVEAYGEYPPFGRVTVRQGSQLVALGVVKTVERISGGGDFDCLVAE